LEYSLDVVENPGKKKKLRLKCQICPDRNSMKKGGNPDVRKAYGKELENGRRRIRLA